MTHMTIWGQEKETRNIIDCISDKRASSGMPYFFTDIRLVHLLREESWAVKCSSCSPVALFEHHLRPSTLRAEGFMNSSRKTSAHLPLDINIMTHYSHNSEYTTTVMKPERILYSVADSRLDKQSNIKQEI